MPDRRRADLVRLAEWLLLQDVHELARKHQVRGAETFGLKTQAARLETSYDEVGFAYEVYPAGQCQRRKLLALLMVTASGFELYERP